MRKARHQGFGQAAGASTQDLSSGEGCGQGVLCGGDGMRRRLTRRMKREPAGARLSCDKNMRIKRAFDGPECEHGAG